MVDLQRLRDWPGIPRRADIVRGIVATHAANYNQTHWRFRSGDTDSLNGTTDWAAAEDTSPTIGMGTRFRLRIKIDETNGDGTNNQDMHLQVRHPEGSNNWHDVNTKAESDLASLTPAALIRTSSQYADGDATTELLTNEGQPFEAGQGEEDNIFDTSVDASETEFEFCLFILRFYEDVEGTYQEISVGDTLEFRIVEGAIGSSTVFTGTYNLATLSVGNTANYFGGTLAETPNRTLWQDGNGNLYALCEPTSTITPAIMMKSTDDGVSWTEVDKAGKPADGDLESADGVLVGDTIHIVIQHNDEPQYHQFHVSTHGTTPDQWDGTIINELVDTTDPAAADQAVSVEVRSDGSVAAFYIRDEGGLDKLYGNVRSGGSWGTPFVVENETDHWVKGVSTVISPVDDLIYIFYRAIRDTVTGELYMRTLDSNDTLSGRTEMDVTGDSEGNRMSTAVRPVLWDNGGVETVMVAYIDYDDTAMYSQVVEDGTISGSANRKRIDDTDVYQGSDSEQLTAVMDIDAADNFTVHVVFADDTTQDIWHDESENDGGWGVDTELNDGVTCERLVGLLREKANGDIVMAYLYDEESAGFMGDSFYDEVFIRQADTGQTFTQAVAGAVSFAGAQTRKTSRTLAGAVGPAGVLSRQTSKQVAGAAGFSGLLSRVTSKEAAGSLSSSGALSSLPRKLTAGALSPSGALVSFPQKLLSGSLSPSATLTRETRTSFSGSVSPVGVLLKEVRTLFSGSLDFTGVLSTKQVVTHLVSGTLDFAGSLLKTTRKRVLGGLSLAGALVAQAKKLTTGELSFSGLLSRLPRKSVSGSLGFSGALTTEVFQFFTQLVSGTLGFSGDLSVVAKKLLSGQISPSGAASTKTGKVVAGTLSFVGVLFRATKKPFSGDLSFSGILSSELVTAFQQSVSGVISPSGALTKAVQKKVSGAVSFGGDLLTTVRLLATGQISPSGVLSGLKTIFQTVTGSLDFGGTVDGVLKAGGAVVRNLIDFLRITDIDDPEG